MHALYTAPCGIGCVRGHAAALAVLDGGAGATHHGLDQVDNLKLRNVLCNWLCVDDAVSSAAQIAIGQRENALDSFVGLGVGWRTNTVARQKIRTYRRVGSVVCNEHVVLVPAKARGQGVVAACKNVLQLKVVASTLTQGFDFKNDSTQYVRGGGSRGVGVQIERSGLAQLLTQHPQGMGTLLLKSAGVADIAGNVA